MRAPTAVVPRPPVGRDGWQRVVFPAVTVAAVGVGAVAAQSVVTAAIVLGVLVLCLVPRRAELCVIAAGATLPLSQVLIVPIGGFVLPAADIAAALGIALLLLARGRRPGTDPAGDGLPGLGQLLPLIALAAPYFAFAAVNAAYHFPTAQSVVTLVQRGQMVLLWLVFGYVVCRTGRLPLLLGSFLTVNVGVAGVYVLNAGEAYVLGVQKNAAGGYFASALLVSLLLPMRWQYRTLTAGVLAAGLVASGSRGSLVGLVAGLVVLVLLARYTYRAFPALLVMGAMALVGFAALPADARMRLLSQNKSGQQNVGARELFWRDALAQFREDPWTGVGVGNYRQIDSRLAWITNTHDPHSVFFLTLAEGGYVLLAGLLLMLIGTVVWVLRRRVGPVVVMAVVVQVSIVSHCLVDVYWVRGTPAVGWLLLGAAAVAGARAARAPLPR